VNDVDRSCKERGDPAEAPRMVVAWQGSQAADHPGEFEAFQRAVSDGRISGLDLVFGRSDIQRGPSRVRSSDLLDEIEERVLSGGVGILYFQYFHGRQLPDVRPLVRRLSALREPPVIITSCGDALGSPLNPVPASLLQAASVSDLVLVTSMGRLASRLMRVGAPRVTLMPLAADQAVFPLVAPPAEPEHDVVFVGSLHGRNPLRRHWWVSQRRRRLVGALQRRFGSRFALYGHGWEGFPSWRGAIPYREQVEAMAQAAVVVGGYPGSLGRFYASDRLFVSLRSGRPLVDWEVSGVEALLRPGEEWVPARTIPMVVNSVEVLLADENRSRRLAEAGSAVVDARHLRVHRCDLFLRMAHELLLARAECRKPQCPPLDFVDPQVGQVGMSFGW